MPRTIPIGPPPGDAVFSRRPVTIAALELKVVTPMFGGGSTPGRVTMTGPFVLPGSLANFDSGGERAMHGGSKPSTSYGRRKPRSGLVPRRL